MGEILLVDFEGAVVTPHPIFRDHIRAEVKTDKGVLVLSISRPDARKFIQDLDSVTTF